MRAMATRRNLVVAVGAILVLAASIITSLSLKSATADGASSVSPAFAVLQTGSPPALNDAERHSLDSLVALHPSYGMQIDQARVAATISGFEILAVPADDRVCLVALASTSGRTFAPSTCRRTAEANRAGVMLRLGVDAPFTVLGLVPDGVASVEIQSEGGSTRSLAVTGNAYAGEVKDNRATVSFSSPATGDVTQALSLG